MSEELGGRRIENLPHKENIENILQIRAIAPPDFHLRGKQMIHFLHRLTEAGEMVVFGRPIALDASNYEKSIDAAPHPLLGKIKPHDENGIIPWRDSWCTVCVYNGTRDENGVQVTVTAHSCGDIPQYKFLRVIHSALNPSQMKFGRLSTIEGSTHEFKDYELKGDEPFKKIVTLLRENPKTKAEKIRLGQLLEQFVLERKKLNTELSRSHQIVELAPLDKLLLKDELKKLQKIFGDYEGILEEDTANKIIKGEVYLESFPYYKRYEKLTDMEIIKSEASAPDVKNICMIGGGWLPISAIMYAQKTKAHIHVVEKIPYRAEIARKVIEKLGLKDKITIINQKAQEVDYGQMDIIVFAAMADPKYKILEKASDTDYPRTIIIRTPLGDTRAFYQGTYYEDLIGPISYSKIKSFNHWFRPGFGVQAEPTDPDGIFNLIILDSIRVLDDY